MVLLRVKGAGLAFLGVVCGFCFWALSRGIRMIEDVGYYGYLGFRSQDFIAGFDISSFGFQAGSQFTCLAPTSIDKFGFFTVHAGSALGAWGRAELRVFSSGRRTRCGSRFSDFQGSGLVKWLTSVHPPTCRARAPKP